MKGILLPAYVEGISTRRDNTIKVVLGTQELTPEKSGELFSLSNKLVSVYISPSEIQQSEYDLVDKINPEFGGKTQSERLRNVLFLNWKDKSEGYKDFDSYYKAETEIIIEHYKSKLPQQ